MERREQVSVNVEVVMSHICPINECRWLTNSRIGKLLSMMKWNDLVLPSVQDEGGTLGFFHLLNVLEALGHENAQEADLVPSNALDTCVG